ncbi:MAG: leucine-rich repeat protein, partial [Paludibacteraceae bacterium]|nr:leucine-rich repeat protein [Paludibacteraceae bacterium]
MAKGSFLRRCYILALFVFFSALYSTAANWLCFTAEEAGSEIGYYNHDNTPNLEYSYDGSNWSLFPETEVLTLAKVGDKVYFRGDNPNGFSKGRHLYTNFAMKGKIAASGSVMSLIDGDGTSMVILGDTCFSNLFYGCSALTTAPELPATTLTDACYFEMFKECSSLEKAPELPAEVLTPSCYGNMFMKCTSLIEAPELPAAKMERACYAGMFSYCTSLTEAPALPATELAYACYSSTFYECKNLTKAPELPAEDLVEHCYWYLFGNCTKLDYIKVGTLSLDGVPYATEGWVSGVKSSGTFVFPCGSKYDKHGDNAVPNNFKIIGSPIIIFQNPDGTELWRDTIACDVVAEYKGETPYLSDRHQFVGWDKELTIHPNPGIYYYTAIYVEPTIEPIAENVLCFTAEEAGSEIGYVNQDNAPDVQYSIDGDHWYPLAENEKVTLENVGDRVYLKGNNPDGFSHGKDNYTSFTMTGRISASGSVMSLIDGLGISTTIPSSSCFRCLFKGCNALVSAPELTATDLSTSCYANMFSDCTELAVAPELLSTTLAPSCYYYMFSGCSNLREMPYLPAETLTSSCYFCMFLGCKSLMDIKDLPVTTLAPHCYQGMFQECTDLTYMPELPITTLEEYCYTDMFHGCTGLTKLQYLPAQTLAAHCYENMFKGCTSLTYVDYLPAEELTQNCYAGMFSGCTNMQSIAVGVLSLDNDFDATKDWVEGIDGDGFFSFPCGSKYDKHGVSEVPANFKIESSPIVIFQNPDGTELWRDTIGCDVVAAYKGETPTYGEGLVFKGWDKPLTVHELPGVYYYTAEYREKADQSQSKWLCFTAEEAGSKVWYVNGAENSPKVQYSFDGKEWQDWDANVRVTLDTIGAKVYVRGDNPNGFSHDNIYDDVNGPGTANSHFAMSGRIAASGSVMSLIDEEGLISVIPCEYCFSDLFCNCTSLTKAPKLPATDLTPSCYALMFEGCTNLTQAPQLPAMDMASKCYISMFRNCSSLVDVPAILPATHLEDRCYSGMFGGCTSLTKAPELPAVLLAPECYYYMFNGCTSLVEAPELVATGLAERCYYYMFKGCTSLVQAPDLTAVQLVKECYAGMFNGCASLNYIKVSLMTLDNDFDATKDWVEGVDGEGLFIFICGSKYDKHGISEVPDNFKIISSPIVIFQNPDSTVLWRDTIPCGYVPAYKGGTPTYGEGLVFKGWDKRLTNLRNPDVYYYTAVYMDEDVPLKANWLCFTAEEAGSEVWYENRINAPDVQYSIDGGVHWSPWEEKEKITLENVGDKVYVRGNNPNGFSRGDISPEDNVGGNCTYFAMSGSIAASGSVMSLIDEDAVTTVVPCEFCFANLFYNCTALTKAPELPAQELAPYCYEMMFCGCTNLTQAPELPSLTLASGCYAGMFYHCEGLKVAPQLPATELIVFCYQYMFEGCSSLIVAPELPSQKMQLQCYEYMFKDCTSLTEAPVLSSTHLATGCYQHMFEGCTSLEKAPVLPASVLKSSCYDGMFRDCANLNYIKVGVKDLESTNFWVFGVDGEGVFIFPCGSKYDKHGVSEVPDNFKIISSPIVIFQNPDSTELWRDTIPCDVVAAYKGATPTYGDDYVFVGWEPELSIHEDPDIYYYTAKYEKKPEPVEGNWLCFTAKEDSAAVWYGSRGDNHPDVQYSFDGNVWLPLDSMEVIPLLHEGDKVYVRGVNPNGFSRNEANRTSFQVSGKVAASGSVMSLIDGVGDTKVIPCDYCFVRLFADCRTLTKAPDLPATTLTKYCYEYMFSGCTNLVGTPELPATQMEKGCYASMFSACVRLNRMPVLPATEMADACYVLMFSNCSSLLITTELPATQLAEACYAGMFNACAYLSVAPELPATEMKDYCYMQMFSGCTSLSQPPRLPATKLADYCYSRMFSHCIRMTNSPVLPATELKQGCYKGMFDGCPISQAPELPATKLAAYCYYGMFNHCKYLTEAPELPAKTLVDSCYAKMFSGSSNIKYIKVGVMTLDNDFGATDHWVEEMDGPGLFVFPCGSKYDKHGISEVPANFTIKASPIIIFQNPDSTVLGRDTIGCDVVAEYRGETPTYGDDYEFVGWDPELKIHEEPGTYYYTAVYEKKAAPAPGNWLCFTAVNSGASIGYRNYNNTPDVQYSVDGGETWQPLAEGVMVRLANAGDKIYFKGNNPNGFSRLYDGSTIFEMNGLLSASGSVMSLIDGEGVSKTIPNVGCFFYLFSHCETLIQAPELPATTLQESCYEGMFLNCDHLQKTPDLPAKKLEKSCYRSMFMSCYGLTDAGRILPATQLAPNCYDGMFTYCSSLKIPPTLPATDLATNCYNSMFEGCISLTEAPELPATQLADSCYMSMFSYCDSLIRAPELPAETLAVDCYMSMFDGCKSLVKAPELPAKKMEKGCYAGMFVGCESLTEAPVLSSDQLADSCYSFMFAECTNLVKAPELPATQLAESCYLLMFRNCSNLNYIKVGVMTLDNDFRATEEWVSGVDGSGVFIFPCGSKYDKHGISKVPKNFKIINSPIIVFQNPDSTVLWRDTIPCDVVAEYKGETPILEGYEFVGWDKEFSIHEEPGTYYYTAVYNPVGSHYTMLDSVLSACDSLVLKGRLFTESVIWKDTVANVAEGDTSVIAYHLQISHSMARDSFLSACESFTYEGILYQENATWSDTLTAVSGCDSIINYHLTIQKGVEVDTTIVADERFTWKGITYTEDSYWSDTLQTVTGCDSVVNYTLVVKKFKQLHLTVDDDLILVLPGGNVLVDYDLSDGVGSRYEIRYGDKLLCGGDVENDSTVTLLCPSGMEPGTYNGTMVMYDAAEGKAEAEFVFNVMLPDSKENSYYVKVWNDVVICRNGDGLFESFQWYKDRQVLDDATLQYYNDLTLLDGEYMVYVNDKYGKSYFIEPIRFEEEKAAYALTATPALVDRGADITVTVSGIDSEQMENARIVVFKSDGRVWRIHETVQEENHMNLWTGEYLLVLTV